MSHTTSTPLEIFWTLYFDRCLRRRKTKCTEWDYTWLALNMNLTMLRKVKTSQLLANITWILVHADVFIMHHGHRLFVASETLVLWGQETDRPTVERPDEMMALTTFVPLSRESEMKGLCFTYINLFTERCSPSVQLLYTRLAYLK